MDFHAYEEGFKNILFSITWKLYPKCFRSYQKTEDRVRYNTYDSPQFEKDFNQEMLSALEFIKTDFFGIEIDLDALPNIASSHDFERFLNRGAQSLFLF
jgi:formiminoglutamase